MQFFLLQTLVYSIIENRPTFQKVEKQDHGDEGYILVGQNINLYSNVKANTFHLSSVKMMDVKSIENNAFGRSDSEQYGGAFYLSNSKLLLSMSIIQKQMARSGGALAMMSCQAYIYNTEFENNMVFRYGGDIFASGEIGVKESWLLMKENNFIQSTAEDVGGSIVAQLLDDLYVENCKFVLCKAGFAGGSMYISHTNSKFFNSTFNHSIVQYHREFTKGNYNIGTQDDHFKGPLVRGAGSLVFYSGSTKSTELVTQNCKFVDNEVLLSTNLGIIHGKQQFGIDVTLIGQVYYMSMNDTFSSDFYNYDDVFLGDRSVGQKEIVIPKTDSNIKNSKMVSKSDENTLTIIPAFNFFGSKIERGIIIISPTPNVPKYPNKKESTSFPNTDIPNPTDLPDMKLPPTRYPFATTRSFRNPPAMTFDLTKIETLPAWATPSVTETPAYTPFPTNSVSVSPTQSPSDSPTPSESWDINFQTLTPKPTRTASPSMSVSASRSVSATNSISASKSRTRSAWPTRPYASASLPPSQSPAPSSFVPTQSRAPTQSAEAATSKENAEEGIIPGLSNTAYYAIIGGVTGVLTIAAVAVFIICFFFKPQPSSSSSVEMMEETILNYPGTIVTAISQDNPLWTTSVIGTDDDPFQNEFEETKNNNLFFRVSRYEID